MRRFFKYLSIFVAAAGLIITFADLKGWFPKPRQKLAIKIISLGKETLPLDAPSVNMFLEEFLFSKSPKYRKYVNQLNGIVIEDIMIGAARLGTVYIEHQTGRRHKVCSFQDLKEWAASDNLIRWIGWSLLLVGTLVGWGLDILKRRKETDSVS